MTTRTYSLTEEVARQTVEVAFKSHADWHIAFSNPTAGPWKTIKLPDANGRPKVVGTYLKEDTRPDLALYSAEAGILILIEAKKSVAEMLGEIQMSKSIGMFGNEIERFRSFTFHGDVQPDIVTGFLYPTLDPNSDLGRLETAYENAVTKGDLDISSHGLYVTFLISQEADGLQVSWFYAETEEDEALALAERLKQHLPPAIARHLTNESSS